MGEPGCVSDARVGEGSSRVQPDRAGLQSPARSQYRGVPRLDCRAPGLKSTLEAVLSPKSASFGLRRLATEVIPRPDCPAPNAQSEPPVPVNVAGDKRKAAFQHGLHGLCTM